MVKPYLYHRAMDFMTFGALPKYIKSKQIFMNNNTQLCEYLKIAPENLVEIIPKYLYEK